jgi:phosphoribosyl 1,2-cyclic phosphate phosphodiesterase
LVLNALRKTEHISHFSLEEAVSIAKDVGAERTYLTHISHQMGCHDFVNRELPDSIQIAYDGLKVSMV